MFTIYKGQQKDWTLFVYLLLVCFLHVKSIHGLTPRQINEKLGYIEEKINAESKFRIYNFNTLFNEIHSLKEMMQQKLKIKKEGNEENHIDKTGDDINEELEEQILRLKIGFKEEKKTNARLRRKTQELNRQFFDLQSKTDKITDVLERLLKGVEILTKQKEERENYFKLFDGKISEIKISVQNITQTIEETKSQEEQRYDTLQTYMENITESIEHLETKKNQCLENVNITNGTIISEKDEYLIEKVISKEHQICSCSNATYMSQSIPSPERSNVLFKSCKGLYSNGIKSSGKYQIDIGEEKPLSVYCDMETDGGGWTVFQRRQDGSVDFFRDWNEYKYGFGESNGELWLGNKYLNLLTDNGQQHELRIDLEAFDGNHAYAKYQNFKVLSEEMKYMLEVNGYKGNAGDSLEDPSPSYFIHNKMKFSTKDEDNDNNSGSCASYYPGAWWFNDCFSSHLNGLYSQDGICEQRWNCIIWDTWKGSKSSMKFTEMKLR